MSGRTNGRRGRGRVRERCSPGNARSPYAEVCAQASSELVAAALRSLGPVDQIGSILDQSEGQPATLLAGEQVSHLAEAWQYLGAAIRSLLCNSEDNAVHFAYYAQLRAAKSIFCANGIRVKQEDCFYLSGESERVIFHGPGTHKLVWDLWKEWVDTEYARSLIGESVVAAGISLNDIEPLPSSSGQLVSAWGYDLAKGAEDRHARNAASYDAKSRAPSPLMDNTSIDLVRRMWSLLFEQGDGVLFDAALIRFVVDKYLTSKVDQALREGRQLHKAQLLEQLIDQTSRRTGASSSLLFQFFSESVDLKLFEIASKEESKAKNVLSRALFLVRLGTLALSRGLSSYNAPDCRVWLTHWLEGAGLYSRELHGEPSEIAGDYEYALEEFEAVNLEELPASVWRSDMAQWSALLSRPEGFVGWALPLAG